MDLGRFAVEQTLCANNLSSKNFGDALMTETNAEQRHARGEPLDHFFTHSRFSRPSRTWRNADVRWPQFGNFIYGDVVVAPNDRFTAEFAKILDEVVSERIVIIEDEKHVVALLRLLCG